MRGLQASCACFSYVPPDILASFFSRSALHGGLNFLCSCLQVFVFTSFQLQAIFAV